MPYPPEHKPRTRQRILRSAAALFASRGFRSTSIDDVMAAAGLTRGAFYTHFRSKAALHAEAMRGAGEHFVPADPRLSQHWVDEILAPVEQADSRASALSGPWAFLVADIANADPAVRAGYAAAVRRLAERAGSGAPADGAADAGSLASIALLVGSLAIAATSDDAALRRDVVAACRARLEAEPAGRHEGGDTDLLWSTPASGLH